MNCTYEIIDGGYIGPFKQWWRAPEYRKKALRTAFDRSLVNLRPKHQMTETEAKMNSHTLGERVLLQSASEKTLSTPDL